MNLLERLLQHARATAEYSVYFGKGRDTYDVRGRTAHESLFNAANGTYRGPSSQQGYSPFSTWTRGLAWAMLGFAEQLEFLATIDPANSRDLRKPKNGALTPFMRRRWRRVISTSITRRQPTACRIGIPARRGLRRSATGDRTPADPFNDHEPVDSSAAAIAAQGLLRLARVAAARGADGTRYEQAGLRVLETLIDESGPVPEPRRAASGAAAAFDLSPSERMGSRARRLAHSARRVEHVGRLPSARGGAPTSSGSPKASRTTRSSEAEVSA